MKRFKSPHVYWERYTTGRSYSRPSLTCVDDSRQRSVQSFFQFLTVKQYEYLETARYGGLWLVAFYFRCTACIRARPRQRLYRRYLQRHMDRYFEYGDFLLT